MKRIIRFGALIIALAVMLGALPAMAAGGEVTIYHREDGSDEDFYPQYVVYHNSTLYLFGYDYNYRTWSYQDGLSDTFEIDRGDLAGDENSMDKYVRGGTYTSVRGYMADDDAIYCLTIATEEEVDEDENYSSWFKEAKLARLTLNEAGVLAMDEDAVELDWYDMIESYGDSEYSRQVDKPIIVNGKLVFSTYTDNGRGIGVYDIASGDGELFETQMNVDNFCVKGDELLIVNTNYEDDGYTAQLHVFDLETGEAGDPLCDLPTEGYQTPSNLAYDEATDSLYYILNGELWRMAGMDPAAAESIAAVQIEGWSDMVPIITEEGYFVCGDWRTIIARNLDPSMRAETSLKVYTSYNNYMDDAYYDFTARHPEVEVIKANTYSDLIQAMLNRNDNVDVYVISTSGNDYSALFDRGYMAELTGSQVISDFVESVYPSIQAMVTKNGEVYGVPVSMWVNGTMSYNPQALEKAGLTEDDVPTTWMEYLQLLQRVPALVEDNDKVRLFDAYRTVDDVRFDIFYTMLSAYTTYMQAGGTEEMSFNTELMRSLLEEFEKIDFSAMGLMESYEDDYVMATSESENSVLFNGWSDISPYANRGSSSVPLLLAMEEGAAPMLDCNIEVAFVNPFSQNRELAIEYIEDAVKKMQGIFLVQVCPDKNEPIRNSYFEENLKYYDEQIETMKAELEKASEEDKESWQSQIDDMETWRQEYEENYAWDATEESIAKYRGYADYMHPTRSLGMDDEGQETYYMQISEYLEGNVDGPTMLKNIDDKLKMMLMEGM